MDRVVHKLELWLASDHRAEALAQKNKDFP